jgi:peroxiredoxin
MTLYNEILPELASTTRNLGISVEGVWCHAAFARDLHLHFPPLADFEPKGDVARKYRAYRASEGVCERALAHPVVNQVQRHFGGRMRIVSVISP